MKRLTVGKIILSVVAVFGIVTPYLADWNVTHIYNPTWPPHAKFHNAQTMLLGTLLGLLALWFLWRRRTDKATLQVAVIFVSLFWVSQAGSILFPGTAFADPGYDSRPTISGFKPNQDMLDAIILAVIYGGYALSKQGLAKQKTGK